MRRVGLLILGLLGIGQVIAGQAGARWTIGDHALRADWVGFLILGLVFLVAIWGRKKETGEAEHRNTRF